MAEQPHSLAQSASPRLPQDWQLAAFDFLPRTRLVFGCGTINKLGNLVAETGANRVLLVTDPGIVGAGHAQRVREILLSQVKEVAVFAEARENPDTVCVDACLAMAREVRPEAIVGLGGGSSMDTGKGCNFLYTNGGRMEDYRGVGRARRPMLPFFAVPTTAGTGSECQSAALIADARTHLKMACLDPKALARAAILDPDLTLSQPPRVAACTGMDAVVHAVETAVTAKRNALSRMYSYEAFRLLVPSLPRVLHNPQDAEARGRMLLGAALAGTAIELSMLGAAHAAANPLTARYQTIHGVAVGVMLPHVVRFNAQDPEVRLAYADLASAPEIACASQGPEEAVNALVLRLEGLLTTCGMPLSLRDLGVDEGQVPDLAAEAAAQWTAGFNPRIVGPGDFERLYTNALQPRSSVG